MKKTSLNPCCGGRCSSTGQDVSSSWLQFVLILVVVEDVLVLIQQTTFNKQQVCLNPCCGGRCSSTRIPSKLSQIS